jgi:hypothetical protein
MGCQFPQPVDDLQKTGTNNIDTTYGGSSAFSWLERDPRQVILFAVTDSARITTMTAAT